MIVKRLAHHAPRCPRCHYGLLLTFGGRGRILCPECATEVSPHESSYHISRWGFMAVAFLLVCPTPIFVTACTWVAWVDMETHHRSSVSERILFLLVFTAFIYITVVPAMLARWYMRHRHYLAGSYATPPGWIILGVNIIGLAVSVAILAFSCVLWAHSF